MFHVGRALDKYEHARTSITDVSGEKRYTFDGGSFGSSAHALHEI